MSLRRRYLDKAGTLLFRNSTMQRYKGNVGCCLFQNTRIFSTHMETTYSVGLLDKPVFDG